MSAKKASAGEEVSERLKERRRRSRRRLYVLLGIFTCVLAGVFVWFTWQSHTRINTVSVVANLEPLVAQELKGVRFLIFPRDSIFFVPTHEIRTAILQAHPEIEAVSIARSSFTSIALTLHDRIAIGKWCGLATTTEAVPTDGEYCYLFDSEGYIFAASEAASTTQPVNPFSVHTTLAESALEPLGATLSHAKHFPRSFDFARGVETFGVVVESISFADDEAELLLSSGASVRYVLGMELEAFADLTSARENLSLTNTSLEYIDLRFPGKVYVKKKDGTVSE